MSQKHDEIQSLKTALKNSLLEKKLLEERLVWYLHLLLLFSLHEKSAYALDFNLSPAYSTLKLFCLS